MSTADEDGRSDVFVRDLQTDTTLLREPRERRDGAGRQRPRVQPSISGDGRFVAFQSTSDT